MGYCESFNGKLRDELLNGEIFYGLKEARIVIKQWRKHCDTVRPHSSWDAGRPRRKRLAQAHSHYIIERKCNKLSIPLVQISVRPVSQNLRAKHVH